MQPCSCARAPAGGQHADSDHLMGAWSSCPARALSVSTVLAPSKRAVRRLVRPSLLAWQVVRQGALLCRPLCIAPLQRSLAEPAIAARWRRSGSPCCSWRWDDQRLWLARPRRTLLKRSRSSWALEMSLQTSACTLGEPEGRTPPNLQLPVCFARHGAAQNHMHEPSVSN